MEKTPDPKLIDPFGRTINYLRLSVTDRCDLRCVYCMAEDMVFLPKKELLTIEELYRICDCVIGLGVNKIRLTGGEPLVRRNIMVLFEMLARHLGAGLNEITLTTNGTLLSRYAKALVDNGVKRINVSLDTLDPVRYEQLTRRGDISRVLSGLDAAQEAGLKVKLNAVEETGGRLGFITPLSCDFCASCNRIRVGSTGKLYPCMGQSGMVELRDAMRTSESDEVLRALILKAIEQKPKGHEFAIEKDGICGLSRHMSELGG